MGFLRTDAERGRPHPQPAPVSSPVSVVEAMDRLERATATPHHVFWPCDVSALEPSTVARRHLLGHRQITDAYLLALATAHGGRFVTLDRSIALVAVPDAGPEHLVVIG